MCRYRSARWFRSRRASAGPRSTPRSWARSSATRCSTAGPFGSMARYAWRPNDRVTPAESDLFLHHRRFSSELFLLRSSRHAAMLCGVVYDFAEQAQAHRRQRTLPQLARGFALFHEAPLLRSDRAGIHAFRKVVDGAPGDRIAAADRPFDCGHAAMARQQGRMVTDAAQARARERFAAHASMGVGGDDQIGPVGD